MRVCEKRPDQDVMHYDAATGHHDHASVNGVLTPCDGTVEEA